jgi:hypothetical protein
MTTAPQPMIWTIPPDRDLLAAIGEMALRHEHLSDVLRMTIRSLSELEVSEVRKATAFYGAAQLRNRVEKLARRRFGECEELHQLQALLERCRLASDKRNDLVHSLWAQEFEGDFGRLVHGKVVPLPTTAEVHAISEELMHLTAELIEARFGGYLSQALARTSAA